MSGTVRQMTPGQAKELAIILAQAGLTDLTYEQAERLLANKGELNAGVRALQSNLAAVDSVDDQPTPAEPPKPQIPHAEICIERMIGGRKFRFRGFIRDDDKDGWIYGDPMLERVEKSGDTPTNKTDNEHLQEHREEWINDPELAPYFIVTGERHPVFSRSVRYFYRSDRGRHWRNLGDRFHRHGLVVCRA
jgi:hypothetical protein